MKGTSHYKEAEGLLTKASGYALGTCMRDSLLAEAQVHATLALAAATVMAKVADGEESPWRLPMTWGEVTA